MTRFEQMQEAGRQLKPADVAAQIASLATDGRFPAVLEAIRQSADNYRKAGGSMAVASDHGKLAWHAGAAEALDVLLQQLRARVDRDTGRQRPDEAAE